MVESLALGRREVVVDRRSQDRVGETDRRAGIHDAGEDECLHRRLQLGAGEPGQLPRVAHLRAVAQGAERPGQRGGRRRLPRQAKQDRVGDAAGDYLAEIGSGERCRGEAASRRLVEQLSDEKRVPAGHLETRTDEPIVWLAGQPRGHQRADGRLRQRGEDQHFGGGIADERRSLGSQRGIERPRRENERERQPLEPARDEGEGSHRWCVTPLKVVDDESQRRIGGEVRGQPVEAVMQGVAGIARGRTLRRRLGGRWGRVDEHVGGQRRRSGQPALALGAVGLQQGALEELADDPEWEPLLKLRSPRAQNPETEVRGPRACLLEQS